MIASIAALVVMTQVRYVPSIRGQNDGWISLFNGKNLDGWIPKIKGYKAGENFGKTFRVENGVIKVTYEDYGGKFNGRFGHLFYKTPYSNYMFEMEYRFTGNQLPDGPAWAWRNSGVMIHGQTPESMGLNQDFPVSAEVQLLGGPETGDRPTGNLCTPGTNVVMDGKLVTRHCTDSKSATYRGDRWVKMGIEVHGNGKVIHTVEGQPVIEYEKIQLDPNDADAKKIVKNGELMISGGTISLQSESHPVEFRNIRLKPLAQAGKFTR